MTAFTDFAENRLTDWFWRGEPAPALPVNWYFGLLTTLTNDAGAPLVEVAAGGTGYARVPAPRSLAAFAGTQGVASITASTGSSGTTSNNADIVFAAPVGDWGTVVGMGVFDAAAGGNLWIYGPLTLPKQVATGDAPPRYPAATFSFRWDD